MSERTKALYERWQQYHREFCESDTYNGDEAVVGAYRDWVDAVMAERRPEFERQEGAKLLRGIGIKG